MHVQFHKRRMPMCLVLIIYLFNIDSFRYKKIILIMYILSVKTLELPGIN